MDDDAAREHGFENLAELFSLVSHTKIDTPESMAAFKDWQFNDGTKAGLLKLNRKESEMGSGAKNGSAV